MPTLSANEQETRNRRAYIAINQFLGTGYELARKLRVNSSYVYTAKKAGGCCRESLWKALVREGMVEPIPRVQQSFMVPLDDLGAARAKFAEHYPDVVLIRQWGMS